jgi:surface antigen
MIERFVKSHSTPAGLRLVALVLILAAAGCSAKSGVSDSELASPLNAPPPQGSPAPPVAADYGGLFNGPLGAKIPSDSRDAAYAALTQALDGGQRRSWKGQHGVFGYFEPGTAAGSCTAFKATTYLAGRPQTLDSRACKSPAGDWRAT